MQDFHLFTKNQQDTHLVKSLEFVRKLYKDQYQDIKFIDFSKMIPFPTIKDIRDKLAHSYTYGFNELLEEDTSKEFRRSLDVLQKMTIFF